MNQINVLPGDTMVYHVLTFLTPYEIYKCSRVCKAWRECIEKSQHLKEIHGCFWINKSLIFYDSIINNQQIQIELGKEFFGVIFNINPNKARELLFQKLLPKIGADIIQNFLQLIRAQAIDHFDEFKNLALKFQNSTQRHQALAAIIKQVASSGIQVEDLINQIGHKDIYHKAHAQLSVAKTQALQNPQGAEQILLWVKGLLKQLKSKQDSCKLWMKIAKIEKLLGKNQETLNSFANAYASASGKPVKDIALFKFNLIEKGYKSIGIDISSYLLQLKTEWSGPKKTAEVRYEILTRIARFELQCYKNSSLPMQTVAYVNDPEFSIRAKLQLIEGIAKLDHQQAIIYLSSIEQDALQSGYHAVYLDYVAALAQIAKSIIKMPSSNTDKEVARNCLVRAKQIIAEKIKTAGEPVTVIKFLGKIAALQFHLKQNGDALATSELAKSFLDKLNSSQLFSARTYLLQYETSPEKAKELLLELEAQIESNIQTASSPSPLIPLDEKNKALKAIILGYLTVARSLLRLSPYEESI